MNTQVTQSALSSRYVLLNADGKPLKPSTKSFAMLHDQQTGLIWPMKDASKHQLDFTDAKDACADFTLGDFTDWDRPTRFELESILDLSRFSPAVDPAYFKNIKSAWYWSKTLDAECPADGAWAVHFGHGTVSRSNQGSTGFVRAVRRVPKL